MFSQDNHTTINILNSYMERQQWRDGVQLLKLAIAKADIDQAYSEQLQTLFNHYSTIRARDVFDCFGYYWNDLKHSNAVDAIDSGFCHLWNINNNEEYANGFQS